MSAFDLPVRASHSESTGEEQLVVRVRAGDESAFEAIYLAHHPALWRFAYGYVRSREIAEEIVQEVFLSLWQARADWDVRTRMRAWLFSAVRHQALNHLRHERLPIPVHDPAGSGAPIAMGQCPPDAHQAMEAAELDDVVEQALRALPERRRLAMTLRWKHGLSPLEISRVLGTTPEAVRVLLTRARQELRLLIAPAHR